MTTLAELAAEPFLSLTTFRRTGEPVSTPLWVAADQDLDALLFWTPASSGKVKRLRHTSRVTVQPCDRSGKVAADAPTLTGLAELIEDSTAVSAVEARIKSKYGLQFRAITGVEKVASLIRRRPVTRLAIRVTEA